MISFFFIPSRNNRSWKEPHCLKNTDLSAGVLVSLCLIYSWTLWADQRMSHDLTLDYLTEIIHKKGAFIL